MLVLERSQIHAVRVVDVMRMIPTEKISIRTLKKIYLLNHEIEIFREKVPTTALPLHQKICNSCDRDDNAPPYPSVRITIGSTIVLVVLFTPYNLAADAKGLLPSQLSSYLLGHILLTTLNNVKNYF